MSERDIYNTPETRVLLRTEDVYQTEQSDDVEVYSDALMAIVADFKNSGVPEGANAQSMVGKSKRGEVACQLFARINPQTGIIEAAGFKARGCLAMTGCASAACILIEGKTIEDALAVEDGDIKAVVDGVPPSKIHALHYSVCAIKALIGDFLLADCASLSELDEACQCDDCSISCIMAEHCSLRSARVEAREKEYHAECLRVQNNALATVCDIVRERSPRGNLTTPADWAHLVPAHLMPTEFDALVFELVERSQNVDASQEGSINVAHTDDDDDFELVPPEGFELVCVDGQWGLVETDKLAAAKELVPNAAGFVIIEGAATKYIYDGNQMRPEFAKWAFLAAEDDPVATFAFCVREESRVYPRPMSTDTLQNHPFSMTLAEMDSIWDKVSALDEYADIKRTVASNDDVYFFSTNHLEPDHAASLAEWASVGRYMNV